MDSLYSLPEDFLRGPGPEVQGGPVEFAKVLPEYDGLWAVVLDGVLSKDECDALTKAAEEHGGGNWERAMVNIGNYQQALRPEVRNCGRIIWDSREVVARIWGRIAEHVPEIKQLVNKPDITGNGPAKRQETWEFSRLNERMRFLKYGPMEYFQPHCDGCYETPDHKERSYYTLHLYLNESTDENKLVGGATNFHSYDMRKELRVKPKIGRVLLFQHRNLIHSGEEVLEGLKLTMRTDLMYTKI